MPCSFRETWAGNNPERVKELWQTYRADHGRRVQKKQMGETSFGQRSIGKELRGGGGDGKIDGEMVGGRRVGQN